MEKLGLPGVDPEGQFLPETYRFIAGTTDLEVLRQAHAALVQGIGVRRGRAAIPACRCTAPMIC